MTIKNVACIDDDPSFLYFIKKTLEQAGFKVFSYDNGLEFISALHNKLLMPDIVLCDLLMPEVSGYNLIWMLKNKEQYKQYHTIPVIALSALEGELVRSSLKEIEADAWIKKPILASRLVAILSEICVSQPTQ